MVDICSLFPVFKGFRLLGKRLASATQGVTVALSWELQLLLALLQEGGNKPWFNLSLYLQKITSLEEIFKLFFFFCFKVIQLSIFRTKQVSLTKGAVRSLLLTAEILKEEFCLAQSGSRVHAQAYRKHSETEGRLYITQDNVLNYDFN